MKTKLAFLLFLFISAFTWAQQTEITLVSWNIRDFGKTKSAEELHQIAQLVRDADVVAIQEVVSGYGGAQAVAKLADELNRMGAKWDYVISNPTNSPKYVTERYAYIWKTAEIKIKNRGNLIKEIDEEVDREPFLIDFYLNRQKFTLINVHSRPFDKNPEREIKALTEYIMLKVPGNVLIAGDFNVNEAEAVFNNFKKSGFASSLQNQKTTLKSKCKDAAYLNYAIDNIFYAPGITKLKSGVIDFVKRCDNLEKARFLSDHLPVFLKFSLKEQP